MSYGACCCRLLWSPGWLRKGKAALWKIGLLVAVKYNSPVQSLALKVLCCWLPRAGRCVGEALLMHVPQHLVLTTVGDGIWGRMDP